MLTHLKTTRALLTVTIAIAAGFVSAKWLAQGNPLVVLPWGALALLTAFIARSKHEALTLGGCLGFIASYSYLWFDNTDHITPSKVAILIFLILLPALFGLLCGLLCSWLGWWVRKRAFR